jgi:hypothetical protein
MITHATAMTEATAVSLTSTASTSGGNVRSGMAINAAKSGNANPAGACARRSSAATTPSFDLRNARSSAEKSKRWITIATTTVPNRIATAMTPS